MMVGESVNQTTGYSENGRFSGKNDGCLVCSRCCQTGLWHTRSRLVLIHFECELDAIIHVRREAISDAKESLRERVLVMACKALDDSAAVLEECW